MCKILVIDDEKVFSDFLAGVLDNFGYTVNTADNGDEGIKSFHNENFDLVITDFFMPGMNGLDVARHIRNSERPDTPILCVTGENGLKDVALFDLIMPKPFRIKELKFAINQLISKTAEIDAG